MKSPAQPDPWIGRSIGDRQRYRIDKRLGVGGMGDVFVAMDTLLGKQVAIKLLKDRLINSEDLRKRFEREVAVCAALKSDHIVEITDYGITAERHPFYVMDYLRGQSLKQLLQQYKRLDVQRTVNIITQVCEGLRLAHQGVTLWRDEATVSERVKVVHRDLKPDNIFLVPTALGELVKILDFGIAKILHETDESTILTGAFIGTFRYAAPEQLRVAKNLDERADIYSLGIIIYEMLSGTNPFGFDTKAYNLDAMYLAMEDTYKPPVPLLTQPGCEHLSPELEAAVMRCLQKAPHERWASVVELSLALQAAPRFGGSGVEIPRPLTFSGEDSDETKVNQLETSTRQIPDLNINHTVPPVRSGIDETRTSLSNSSSVGKAANASNGQIPTPSRQTDASVTTSVLFLVGTGIGISLAAIAALIAYLQLPSPETQVLDDLKTLKTEAKYFECTTKAKTVTQNSTLYKDAQSLSNECQLEYAKQLAAGNNLAAALAALQQIPNDSPLYPEAQVLIKEWSEI